MQVAEQVVGRLAGSIEPNMEGNGAPMGATRDGELLQTCAELGITRPGLGEGKVGGRREGDKGDGHVYSSRLNTNKRARLPVPFFFVHCPAHRLYRRGAE
jgi:hypothetical protein